MNVTIDQLFQQIGKLYIESVYLNQMVAEKNAEISALQTNKKPKEVKETKEKE